MSDAQPMTTAAREMPGYRMLFPAGWVMQSANEESERQLLARARAKVKRLARPDLDFALTAQIKSAFRQLRSQDGIAMYLPIDVDENAVLPMSMTASRLMDPLGLPLDERITEIFHDHGGEFLGTDRKIVRWRRTQRKLDGLPGAVNEQINYVIPVSGTGRRMALLLSTSILQDEQGTIDDERLGLMIELSDQIVGTFTWVSPQGNAAGLLSG